MAVPVTTATLRGPTGLDRGAREALLRPLLHAGVEHRSLMAAFFHRETYGDLDDYLEAVRAHRGFEAAESIRMEMRAMTDRYTNDMRLDWEQAKLDASRIYAPIGFFIGMPQADFLTALEAGAAVVRSPAHKWALSSEINRICERRGLPYRMSGLGSGSRCEWTGDATIAAVVVSPALSALEDPRLSGGAKVEFEGAREQLRKDTPESRKRAVGEVCGAVESAMKVLLSEHGKPLPTPPNLSKLVKLLIAEGIVEAEIREMLVAPGLYGNRKSRHGSGYVSHDVGTTSAEAAVAAGAVAITYLAGHLPARA
jgi:hypothetical protein